MTMRSTRENRGGRETIAALVVAALAGCSDGDAPPLPEPVVVDLAPEGVPHGLLSEWGLFEDLRAQVPSGEVVFYDVNAPLYSDYTFKRRFLHVPAGGRVGYAPEGEWDFPVGTILVKTFSYLADARDPSLGEQLLETRLLVHQPGTWEAHTYIWEGDDARYDRVGDFIDTEWIDVAGNLRTNRYIVPNNNECQECHGEMEALDTLGGVTRQLNREHDYGAGPVNQIDHFASLGWLDVDPPPAEERQTLVDPFGSAPEWTRVRSYLDTNCGHCHTEDGPASQSALLLSFDLTVPGENPEANWGVCKVPTSAGGATCGHTYDVVPGDPDRSIVMCRLQSEDPEVRMPPTVSRIPHAEGNALIRAWIAGMDPVDCDSL
ncbi:MAG: hypothetical protein AAGN82_11075 [Myxococcota bacterium]